MQSSAWSKGLSDLVKDSTHLVGDIKLESAKGGELFGDTGSESSFESLMSHSRCSTLISSASSASMVDRWNVEEYLSCLSTILFKIQILFKNKLNNSPHTFHGKISVCRHADNLCSDVYDNHNRPRNESLKQVDNFLI